MKHRRLLATSAAALCVVAIATSCRREVAAQPAAPPAASHETDPELLRDLVGIPHEPAQGVEALGQHPFFVKTRSEQLTQAPCSVCHADMKPLQPATDAAAKTMHVDITLKHAAPETMDCLTCHSPEDPGRLQTLKGVEVDMNHAYQVCAQCHHEQHRDWVGGAHGKRMAGWRGRRVIMNCADCHDPHSPAFDQRIPEPGPRFPEAGAHHD